MRVGTVPGDQIRVSLFILDISRREGGEGRCVFVYSQSFSFFTATSDNAGTFKVTIFKL